MTTTPLERRVFRSYWDDGLLDVFAATGVTLVGLLWLRDFPAGAAIVPPLLVPLWVLVRRKWIETRTGYVEFSEERAYLSKRRLALVFYLGTGILILAVGGFLAGHRLAALPGASSVAGLPALLLGLLAAVTVLLTGCARFFLYAAMLAAAGLAGAAFGWRPGEILVASGAALLAISLTILVRFLRANPAGREFGA